MILLFLILFGAAQEQAIRFTTYDVTIDTGDAPLAAYQFELVCGKQSRIVGVEGGEGPHFSKAPHYDPAALQGGRIVIAAFTTDEAPPKGRVRVARLHFQETGSSEGYTPRLVTAAAPGGKRIKATIELRLAGGKK